MVGPPTPLAAYIAKLRQAATVRLRPTQPEHETWEALIERMSHEGSIAEIDEETYDWFLECLPPHYQGFGFAFAEGQEPFKYFWKKGSQFFCRQLTWDETVTFCRLAGISIPL